MLNHVQQSGKAIASGFTRLIMIMTVLNSCSTSEQSLPYYNSSALTPLWVEERQVALDTLPTVGNFQFTDQDGNLVTNDTFRNKIYVASFFFTICPNICPRLTANMKLVADEFASDERVRFISHSVTLESTLVARLKNTPISTATAGNGTS